MTVLIFSSKQKSGGIYCVRNCCTNGKNSFYAEDLFVKENYFVVHFMHFFFSFKKGGGEKVCMAITDSIKQINEGENKLSQRLICGMSPLS